MIRKFIVRLAAAAFAVALLAAPRAQAQVVQLWGIQPATNQIVRVNPATGATFLGFTPPGAQLPSPQQFGGLTIAEHGQALLYQNPVGNPTDLFRLNPDTGALLSTFNMPPANAPAFRAGLSFQSGAGPHGEDSIFAVNDGSPVQRQDGYANGLLVNHTPPGIRFAGALGGDDNGRHFVAAQGVIWEFDPLTPDVILNTLPLPIGALGASVGGLAFDGARLYLSTLDTQLFTLDANTGAVLNNVVVRSGPLIGLAARTVPEPGAAALAVVAAAWCAPRRAPGRRRTHN